MIKVLSNGWMVEILPDIAYVGTTIWAHVRTLDGIDGWVLQAVLVTTERTPIPTDIPTP
jgi:SH3-like domain-containing protein